MPCTFSSSELEMVELEMVMSTSVFGQFYWEYMNDLYLPLLLNYTIDVSLPNGALYEYCHKISGGR